MKKTRTVPVSKLALDLENYRLELPKNQQEAIELILDEEDVMHLAKDIAENGLNVFDSIGVMESLDSPGSYIVLEGNRRVCCLKLLLKPELAPEKYQDKFRKIASGKSIPKKIEVVISDRQSAQRWIRQLHEGYQDGVGRKSWNPAQKARAYNKYPYSAAVVNFLKQQGGIAEKIKLSTLERYLASTVFRPVLGKDDHGKMLCSVSPDLLIKIGNQIISDMSRKNGEKAKVSSRADQAKIQAYYAECISPMIPAGANTQPWTLTKDDDSSHEAAKTLGEDSSSVTVQTVSHPKIGAHVVSSDIENSGRQAAPQSPSPKTIHYDKNVVEALERLDNTKLKLLYYSICHVRLRDNAQLLCVGIWSFLETLTLTCGKTDKSDFPAFFSNIFQAKDKLTKDENKVLKEFSEAGNLTKHSIHYGQENSNSLTLGMELISARIVKLIDHHLEENTSRP